MSADISLKDKEAFYAQLDSLDAPSDGDDEAFQRDRQVRDRSRSFLRQAQVGVKANANDRKPTSTTNIDVTASYESPRKTSLARSKTAPTPVSVRSAVIEGTPSNLEQHKRASKRRIPVSTSFVEDTPRQGPRPTGTSSLKRSATNPQTILSSSRPPSDNTTSASNMAKRKREDVIPQEQQLLRGLRFFYIPAERIALRGGRMEHAEKYGAGVTRVLEDATHAIVDDRLTYEDIKSQGDMASVVVKGQPVVVREHWPIDSIASRRLLPTNLLKYRIKGLPTAETTAGPPPEERAASQASEKSLELKAPANNPNKWYHVSQYTTSQSDRSSAPHHDSGEAFKYNIPRPALGQEGDATPGDATAGVVIHPSSNVPSRNGQFHSSPKNNHYGTGPDHEDELSQLIGDVQKKYKDLPALGDEEDDVTEDKDDSGHDSQSGSEDERNAKRQKITEKPKSDMAEHFACNRGGTKDQGSRDGHNSRAITVLQQMLDYYTRTNDHWRIIAYRRVINTLSRQSVRITTAEQAKKLPYIGKELSLKIQEIVNTDRLQRLEFAQNDPTSQILKLFLGIYGVGTSTADKWIAQGFRTLDDLRQRGKLTVNQCVGLDHYDDLNSRIPRAEMDLLGNYVKREATCIDKDVELIIGGSYRRGADSSGDIDFIVTKKGTESSEALNPFLDKLVATLTRKGFLTAELASHHSHGSRYQKNGNGSKWHGCCVLPRIPGSSNDNDQYRPVWRRMDILLVPETEYGAALIYFTGNDIFNRSMRLLASRKKMRLNQRGLYKDVMRGPRREKLGEGELLEGKSEKRIFEILGVNWREPHERWC